jgi:hypothetical protein
MFNESRAIFQQLQDINKFKQFKVDLNTICWENGLYLAPEYLKEKIIEQGAALDCGCTP